MKPYLPGLREHDDDQVDVTHFHHWLEVDATPLTSKRYVVYRYCSYCHETTATYDGGRIPVRRRLWARIKHGRTPA